MSTAEIRELLSLMAEKRCLRIVTPDVTLELSPLAFALPDEKPIATAVGVEKGGEPTAEQLLYWSAGGELPTAPVVPNG